MIVHIYFDGDLCTGIQDNAGMQSFLPGANCLESMEYDLDNGWPLGKTKEELGLK